MVRKPFQSLILFPLGGFNVLSQWELEEQLCTLHYTSIMSQFLLYPPALPRPSSLKTAGSAGLPLSGESGFELG